MKKTKHSIYKEKGFWLSLILIVMALHGIFGTVLYYTIRTQEALDRPWIISLMALHSLANVIAYIILPFVILGWVLRAKWDSFE